ncbi:hypothetical protein FRB90_000800 [Tulasnella sp. 427]|nr:hypothetical protein FRB90_000800 [Tulasnella sp. 427]
MSVTRTPPPTQPSGGRAPGPATRSNRQPQPASEPEPEDSQHPELGESPTILRVGTAQGGQLMTEETPASPDFDAPPRNPYLPPRPPIVSGPLPNTKAEAEATYSSHPGERATVSFESPPQLPKKEPESASEKSSSRSQSPIPEQPPTEQELLEIKDKMHRE